MSLIEAVYAGLWPENRNKEPNVSKYLIRTFAIETPDQPTVTIKDDGHFIHAEWPMKVGNGSTSIGIRRPPPKPDDEVHAMFSQDGKYFYLPGYVRTDPLGGNWMGVDEYATEEEAKEKCQKGIFGPSYVKMTRVKEDNKTIYRELLAFAHWKVKEKQESMQLKTTDPAVQDFLAMCMMFDREDLKRFEEAISFTGRKYAWILDKIGPPVLADAPLPPVLLTD